MRGSKNTQKEIFTFKNACQIYRGSILKVQYMMAWEEQIAHFIS
jgi:hypothetical protein